jgi:dienelactone hydrolase
MATTITFASGPSRVSAELYTPAAPGKGVIVIAYGSDGLVDNKHGSWKTMIRGYAEELAKAGAVAIIPDYLSATGITPGQSAIEVAIAKPETWDALILDAITHAKTHAPSGAKVGLLGFSLGGYLCLRGRRNANALSSYFAPVLTGIGSAVGSRLTHAEIHHGNEDLISKAAEIEAELSKEGVTTELYAYPGAVHGFVGDDPANTKARNVSKGRTLAFFAAHLR